MRIGIDARLTYYRQAGISRYILHLIEGLAGCDTSDEFLILQSIKSREALLERANFEQRLLITPSHHRLERLTLSVELAAMRLDVLHSPDLIPPAVRRYRSVITVHDLGFMLYPHFLTKDAARYYGQVDQAVRHTDAIIAVSQTTKQDAMRLLGVPESKITVIYSAASPAFYPMRSPEIAQRVKGRFGIRGDFILFVSTIEPRKNVPLLLKAFRRLLDSYHPHIKLVLAGEKGWLFGDVFQQVTDLALGEDVLFLGRVSNEELVMLYNSAQMLVAPSIYEGFGFAPLEAMACGTPVIVSNVSSLPEIVGDAGLLVDPSHEEEVTVAMWRLLNDTELRESLIAKGLRRAAVFSWDKTAQETLALYRSLV